MHCHLPPDRHATRHGRPEAYSIRSTEEPRMPKRRDREKAADRDLTVIRTIHVPLLEVSGVTLRREADGDMALIAIGDRSAVAAWVVLPDDDDKPYVWTEVDITEVEGSAIPMQDPQIEAVCADGEGRVLLLQEDPARVELLDWAESRVIASVDLTIPPGHALHDAWLDPEGSRGEGVVLLANGHLLIAKEKDPPAFIEFGPAGTTPSGCTSATVLDPGQAWPVEPGQHEYVALATWTPVDDLLAACADFSDLEVGPDRRLYLLSDKSASIARLPALEPDGGTAMADKVWRLGDIEGKPEGLAFTRHGRAIVALDTKEKTHNLIVLDPPIVTWW
jgi:hypothetical protein